MAQLKRASIMLADAKHEMEDALYDKDRIINKVLLAHGYFVSPDDKVVYLEQLDKVMVYSAPSFSLGTVENYG